MEDVNGLELTDGVDLSFWVFIILFLSTYLLRSGRRHTSALKQNFFGGSRGSTFSC